MIRVNKVSVHYQGQSQDTHALREVSFEIRKSDFVVLLGPSGCGKSTLLKLIAGFESPSEGEVLMHDQAILAPGRDRGVVFQTTNLFPWLSVRDNIEYGLKVNKTDKEEMRALSEAYLEKIKLTDYAKHYPFELSGGMRQRVAVARTLINKPEILLMDEPFGALDAITRVSMQSFVRELWQEENQTILFITHDIDEALSLGNRVLVMSKSPGTILKEFEVDYYKTYLEDPYAVVEEDHRYNQIKHEILRLINTQ